jgi:hypothetical protein
MNPHWILYITDRIALFLQSSGACQGIVRQAIGKRFLNVQQYRVLACIMRIYITE